MSDELVPTHVAIIMDGNGRWAKQRKLPRTAGHKEGVKATQEIIKASGKAGVKYLTLFAFSSENWQRPKNEVSALMDLFMQSLKSEVQNLVENGVRLKFLGD
ncbi:MAG: polyprenyl diphosphate synthase, partial [Gammaproteobacteria bacterium]